MDAFTQGQCPPKWLYRKLLDWIETHYGTREVKFFDGCTDYACFTVRLPKLKIRNGVQTTTVPEKEIGISICPDGRIFVCGKDGEQKLMGSI